MSQDPLLSFPDLSSRSDFDETEDAFHSRGNASYISSSEPCQKESHLPAQLANYASNTEAAPLDNTPRMDYFSSEVFRHRFAATYDERAGLAPLIHYLEGFASPAPPSMNTNGVSVSNPFPPLPRSSKIHFHAEPELIPAPIQLSNDVLFNPTADNSTPTDLRYTQFSASLRQIMSQSDIDPHTLIASMLAQGHLDASCLRVILLPHGNVGGSRLVRTTNLKVYRTANKQSIYVLAPKDDLLG
ncbi:hypothetical protein R3P38DRAFT_2780590 [Favolaschia claudopus]|uniref:Uncharacterized protein n=1 Tax=Favolaschia claudopus TaxID=2862362 RepID=A0AAW0B9C0_9AGAR